MADMTTFGADDDDFASPAPEAAGPTAGVVRVGKRDYAVGLHWNSIQNPSKAAEEARAMASDEDFRADLFCVRLGATPQFGLGSKAAGHKARMPSLAAHLASSKMGSWIGLFAVPGGFYLVAVRDDGILSECDRFIADAGAARDVLENYAGQSTWGETIAPKSMEVPGSVDLTIDAVLDGKAPVVLQDVRQTSNAVKFGLLAVLVVGGVVGFMMYRDSVETARLEYEAAELARLAAEKVGVGQPEVVIPPMPWEGKFRAAESVAACVDAAAKLRTDVPGWRLKDADCYGPTIVSTLERKGTLSDGGTPVTWIRQFVGDGVVSYPPEGTGTTALVSQNLAELPKILTDTKTLELGRVRRALVEVMESRFVPVTISAADDTEFWRGLTFTFKTRDDPKGFADLLAALPAAIMTRIHLDAASAEWTLEGKVYEQLPVQPKQ